MSITLQELPADGRKAMENEVQAKGAVVVSCCGWFHARYAAWAAYQAGMLDRYITTNPRYARVPDECTIKIPLIEYLHTYGNRFMRVPFWDWNLVKKGIFDRVTQFHIKPRDKIFHAFSAFQERCWRRASELGLIKVIDWGTAHPGYLKKLMREEYDLLGIDGESPYEKNDVDRAMAELNQADLVLVPSDFVIDTFRNQGADGLNIRQNPYGADLGVFRQIQKDDNKFRIIFVGQIGIKKGIHYLLEAVNQLHKLRIELLLVGGVRPDFVTFMKDFLHCYRRVPSVPHDELYKYYSNASVFVFPSLIEGMAMVTLEAMACGLPCIVTPNTGSIVRDGKGGFVVPIRDVEALKEKILFFYENEDARVEMGRNAKEYVQQFTWDRYGSQLISYYYELLR